VRLTPFRTISKLIILAEPTIATQPREAALHDPSQSSDFESTLFPPHDLQLVAIMEPQGSRELSTFMAGVGNDGVNRGECKLQPSKQSLPRLAIGDVRWLNPARDRKPKGIDEDVAFPAFHPLVPVEPARSAALGGFD
jgi:hypothetical protein